jgi:hypothetical protein
MSYFDLQLEEEIKHEFETSDSLETEIKSRRNNVQGVHVMNFHSCPGVDVMITILCYFRRKN